jgi:N-acyl-D-amino-acid deacylase
MTMPESSSQGSLGQSDYDIVIRGGRVLDGTGSPWSAADVAIKDGRFAKIGVITSHGKLEIDATGDYVTPGWIDMMDQSGEALKTNGLAEIKILQGVTTAIAGEGGFPVPSSEIEGYFAQLQRQGIALNWGTYYSPAQARREVMGEADGRPTVAQMEAMRRRVEEAMGAGALGLATALIYPPDSFQTTEDLVELVTVAARYGGIYASHVRDEGAELLEALGEAIVIGERAGAQVEIFHFKAAWAPGVGVLMPQAIAQLSAARAHGVNVAANMYPYTAGATQLSITAPNWIFAQGQLAGIDRLRDPETRARAKADVARGSLPGWSNLVFAAGGWHRIVLAEANDEKFRCFEGRNFVEIGAALGEDPADAAWNVVVHAAPKTPYALFFMMDERDIESAIKAPWMAIGSDADANSMAGRTDVVTLLRHPRVYGTFPRVIAEYVRKRGVLSLEDAVRKLTAWPASRMGLYDRGAIREGLRADVTIFNFERLQDTATYAEPTRLPTGIDWVLVNGQIVADHGRCTGARPGLIIRGPGYGVSHLSREG